jgi:hypothetical protein
MTGNFAISLVKTAAPTACAPAALSATALVQIAKVERIEVRKSLIFKYRIFGFCLEKLTLHQSPSAGAMILIAWLRLMRRDRT